MAVTIVVGLAVQYAHSQEHTTLSTVGFFSYFTVLSNISAAAVLAVLAARPALAERRAMSVARGGPTLYMVVTGLVYWVVLKPQAADLNTNLVWVDVVVHQIGPIVVFADWLVNRPPHALTWREAATWMVFPLAWLPYTMVRGAVVDWYPYPFLDPRKESTVEIVVAVVVVAAVMLAIGAGLRWWTTRGAGRQST